MGYAGGYLSFTTPAGDREQIWIVATASGSHYAEPGSPPSLWLCFTGEAWPQSATRRSLEPLGFRDVVDRAGYRSFRVGFPLNANRLAEDLDQACAQVRAWALGLLAEAGFATRFP